ncbi:HAMP domain-containing sensor histidine kinase [Vibrio mytili]|uniref:sensor histidine kinase n=1 Tax=Vibrio mytili TaxID=50718 RepID=UPI002F419663
MWSSHATHRSIKYRLINWLSLVFGFIVFAVFLIVDLSVDGWIDEQFDQSLLNRTESLQSYFSDVAHRSPTAQAMKLHPEFSREDDPEFYQLWQGDTLLSYSPSFDAFPAESLPRQNVAVNTTTIIPTTLPNGLSGKASLSSFRPTNNAHDLEEAPLYLALYKSDHAVEQMLLIIDILLVVGFLGSIALMRYLAVMIVDKGLEPLSSLNAQLQKLTTTEDHESPTLLPKPKHTIDEIEPIRQQINQYIQRNAYLLSSEKRITGDIAHELKTPIAEILTLTEVYMRYPDDPRLGETYQQDVLSIATRMKNIVEKLLLLQRASHIDLHQEELDINDVIQEILSEFSFKYAHISSIVKTQVPVDTTFYADRFSLKTIVFNLVDNALFYRMPESLVEINVWSTKDGMEIEVINQLSKLLDHKQLDKLTSPLYQADTSRTDSTHFGLGLSIVENLCQHNGYDLTISQSESQAQFAVKIHLPHSSPPPQMRNDSAIDVTPN